MFGNPYAERMTLEATYEDTAVISRPQPVQGADGFTRPQPQPVYTGIICALSAVSDSSRQTDAQQNLRYDRKLFVQPDKVVRPGDTVTVSRFGRFLDPSPSVQTFEVVGEPLLYLTHREVLLKAVSLA